MTITRNELGDALRGAIEGLEPLNFLYASSSIRHGCIEQRNIGGYHEAGSEDHRNLALHIYGLNSDFKKLIDLKFACDVVDEAGNISCADTDDEGPERKKPRLDPGPYPLEGSTNPASGSSQVAPLTFQGLKFVTPVPAAAPHFADFYTSVAGKSAISALLDPGKQVSFTLSRFRLEFLSKVEGVITWGFVTMFALQMAEWAAMGFAASYEAVYTMGTAEAVQVSMRII
ncbi:hypothetical protein G7Y79_00029g063580 [Physcia stellaris]|nr:hypothetical protein G7Y79_00029g063580 [Physcia stellaris]